MPPHDPFCPRAPWHPSSPVIPTFDTTSLPTQLSSFYLRLRPYHYPFHTHSIPGVPSQRTLLLCPCIPASSVLVLLRHLGYVDSTFLWIVHGKVSQVDPQFIMYPMLMAGISCTQSSRTYLRSEGFQPRPLFHSRPLRLRHLSFSASIRSQPHCRACCPSDPSSSHRRCHAASAILILQVYPAVPCQVLSPAAGYLSGDVPSAKQTAPTDGWGVTTQP